MLEIAVLDSARDFGTLEEEWGELYRNSPSATPFQSWAWLYSWWESYGKDYELRLVTVRDEGLLVGVIPLMLERKLALGRLLFVGTGVTDSLDVLVREGWEDRVFEVARPVLEEVDSWLVADLQQLRPNATAWRLFRGWDMPQICVGQDGSPTVEVKPWDELLMSVDRKLRSNARRALRRAKEDGVLCEQASQEDAERAARRLMDLHRQMWQGRHIAPEHLTERFESHVVAAASRLTACDLGGIREFWRDGEVIASHFVLYERNFVGEYMFGISQEARRRFQVSSLNMWDLVNVACSRGSAYASQLRGEESYKLQWASEVIPYHRVILGRHRVARLPYAGYHVLYSEARQYANSEDAPKWVNSAMENYRALRSGATRYIRKGRQE
jgi:CelD/BcsL family acetyltransferase involved in cellulose biosynthesis